MHTLTLMLLILPAVLLGVLIQWWIHATYTAAGEAAATISGAKGAEMILQASGIDNVQLEQSPGRHSDHYDSHRKVLRLSSEVYHGRSLAALGIAAHEAGHALQDASRFWPLVIRNLAVPAASFGSSVALLMMLLGVFVSKLAFLLPAGVVLFGGVVLLQLVNLPVEHNASVRAKRRLAELGIVKEAELPQVGRVLSAAALTYLAATLMSVLTAAAYIVQFLRGR